MSTHSIRLAISECDPRAPFSQYREHAGCAFSFNKPLEAVIAKLQRQGLGGP